MTKQAYGLDQPLINVFPQPILARRAPTAADNTHNPGQLWVNETDGTFYGLSTVVLGVADWEILGGSSSSISTLTGDSGGAITPVDGNIDIDGGTNINTVGTAGTITINLDTDLIDITSITALAATDLAITAAEDEDIVVKLGDAAGANKLSFIDSADVEQGSIDSDGIMTMDTFVTSSATLGVTYTDNTVTATGSDANIGLNLVPKGTGGVIHSRSAAGVDITFEATNSDNTNAASNAGFEASVGGTASGNAYFQWLISGGQVYTGGIDNATPNDDWVLSKNAALGTGNIMSFDGTTDALTLAAGVTATTGDITATAGDLVATAGNVSIAGTGQLLEVKGGLVTDFVGTATLASGTVTIANTNIVAATDAIQITRTAINGSTALGGLTYTISDGASFTITSVQLATPAATETNDTSIVEYFIYRKI